MLLENKTAVIYGGAGAIGGATAHAFAREGAHVFLAGRTKESLTNVAEAIRKEGGMADFAVVDAFNKASIEQFQDDVVKKTGRLDISFNVVGLDDRQGAPLTEMAGEDFTVTAMNAMMTHFLTATIAARQMERDHAGVILALPPSRPVLPAANVGGFGADAQQSKGFARRLACESGHKVFGLFVCARRDLPMLPVSTKSFINMQRMRAFRGRPLKRDLPRVRCSSDYQTCRSSKCSGSHGVGQSQRHNGCSRECNVWRDCR